MQQPADGRQISDDSDAAVGTCGFEHGWIGQHIRVIGIRPHAVVDALAAGSYTKDLFTRTAAAAGQSVQEFLEGGLAQGTLLKRLPTLAEQRKQPRSWRQIELEPSPGRSPICPAAHSSTEFF